MSCTVCIHSVGEMRLISSFWWGNTNPHSRQLTLQHQRCWRNVLVNVKLLQMLRPRLKPLYLTTEKTAYGGVDYFFLIYRVFHLHLCFLFHVHSAHNKYWCLGPEPCHLIHLFPLREAAAPLTFNHTLLAQWFVASTGEMDHTWRSAR